MIQLHTVLHPDTMVLPDALAAILDSAERARLARFHADRERQQYQLSRVFERVVLADHLATSIDRLRFARNSHGKPRLSGEYAGRVELSISHSDGVIVVALADASVGVDVERCDRRAFPLEALAIACEEGERARIMALPEAQRGVVAYRVWTCKEAVLKADGRGLAVSPREVPVPDPAALLADSSRLQLSCHGRAWDVTTLPIHDAWRCAVATAPASARAEVGLTTHTWQDVVQRALAA
jgi:4'-phosphopantetheinyl transferase